MELLALSCFYSESWAPPQGGLGRWRWAVAEKAASVVHLGPLAPSHGGLSAFSRPWHILIYLLLPHHSPDKLLLLRPVSGEQPWCPQSGKSLCETGLNDRVFHQFTCSSLCDEPLDHVAVFSTPAPGTRLDYLAYSQHSLRFGGYVVKECANKHLKRLNI